MLTEIVFLFVGFIFGIFDEHFKHIARGVWKHQWGEVWQGMKHHFFRHYVPLLIVIALMLTVTHFYDRWQQQIMVNDFAAVVADIVAKELDQRDDALIKAFSQSNRDIVERLDRLIEVMETDNATTK